jgi:YidC/Oxa1 family membrane protein insertase
MSPRALRIVIPLAIATVVVGLVVFLITSGRPATTSLGPAGSTPAETPASPDSDAVDGPADGGQSEQATGERPVASPDEASEPEAANGEDSGPSPAADGTDAASAEAPPQRAALVGLRAVAPEQGISGHETPPQSFGSLDPAVDEMQVEFSRAGAGIARITFSDIWETAAAKRKAEAHKKDPSRPAPDPAMRYVLERTQPLVNANRPSGIDIPALAADTLVVNGTPVNVFDYNRDDQGEKVFIWSEVGPGAFQTVIVDEADTPILRVTRRYTLREHYEIDVDQALENLTDGEIDVRWQQWGLSELRADRSRYLDRRRFRFGYLDPERNPSLRIVFANDNDEIFERRSVLKRWKRSIDAAGEGDAERENEQLTLWPNRSSRERKYELSWFGATNRYFGFAVHPLLEDDASGDRSLTWFIDRILIEVAEPQSAATKDTDRVVFTYFIAPQHTIAPQATMTLEHGVYAGPLDREILEKYQPYVALNMDALILYQMSGCCATCTFQWLAHGLLWFLSAMHDYVVFDWAVAIIILVIIVRTLLHPLTKRSQVSMQRFGKVMQEIKPEIEKLQKKYANDPKKLQQEQMRMMRERGANPLQMLGCLPMFLQMPIWVALYAMLYFAFELRHEAAFWGIFQLFGNWSFLGDLSAPDRLAELPFHGRFFTIDYSSINVLPLLMGIIFFIQQKYMSPPPSPTMTKEQLQQQKIMKVLMVGMFPLMLYSAPSGLTLYILTSSCIGILESRYIRAHIKEMELNPKSKTEKQRRKVKPKDAQGRAYARALQRMQEKREKQRRGPEKKYKKRR